MKNWNSSLTVGAFLRRGPFLERLSIFNGFCSSKYNCIMFDFDGWSGCTFVFVFMVLSLCYVHWMEESRNWREKTKEKCSKRARKTSFSSFMSSAFVSFDFFSSSLFCLPPHTLLFFSVLNSTAVDFKNCKSINIIGSILVCFALCPLSLRWLARCLSMLKDTFGGTLSLSQWGREELTILQSSTSCDRSRDSSEKGARKLSFCTVVFIYVLMFFAVDVHEILFFWKFVEFFDGQRRPKKIFSSWSPYAAATFGFEKFVHVPVSHVRSE